MTDHTTEELHGLIDAAKRHAQELEKMSARPQLGPNVFAGEPQSAARGIEKLAQVLAAVVSRLDTLEQRQTADHLELRKLKAMR